MIKATSALSPLAGLTWILIGLSKVIFPTAQHPIGDVRLNPSIGVAIGLFEATIGAGFLRARCRLACAITGSLLALTKGLHYR